MSRQNSMGMSLVSGLVVAAACFGLLFYGALVAHANDPSGAVQPQSEYRLALDSQYRGGASGGYGKARAFAVTATPASASMTTMSTNGVHLIHFTNLGSGTVLSSLNGTSVSTANCQMYLPPGLTFTSITKSRVSTVWYYCPTGTATLVVAE